MIIQTHVAVTLDDVALITAVIDTVTEAMREEDAPDELLLHKLDVVRAKVASALPSVQLHG